MSDIEAFLLQFARRASNERRWEQVAIILEVLLIYGAMSGPCFDPIQ
jgi:hypothetical protein